VFLLSFEMNDIPQPEELEQPEIKWLTLVLYQQAVNMRGRSTKKIITTSW
jgi:hypothetical protein